MTVLETALTRMLKKRKVLDIGADGTEAQISEGRSGRIARH